MALPQGINFRSSAGYVTDVSPDEYEIGTTANYPRTTAAGITVGWEQAPDLARDRSSANNAKLAGHHYSTNTNPLKNYRIDLPATGDYNIRLAAGDALYAQTCKVELFDTTTSLGVVCDGSTGAANSFFDAGGNIRTHAAWVSSNTAATKTFGSTIFRCRIGGAASGNTTLAHLYVESAGGAAATGYLNLPLLGVG